MIHHWSNNAGFVTVQMTIPDRPRITVPVSLSTAIETRNAQGIAAGIGLLLGIIIGRR